MSFNRSKPGILNRRELLRIGLGGFASLSLPGLLNWRAKGATSKSKDNTAVILVWLRGGCSHLDTYDPKPLSGSEFASPYKPIATRVTGLQLTELLPHQAKIADKFTLLRSMAHTGPGHPAGSLQLLSGDSESQDKQKPELPDFMSVAHYLRQDPARQLPNFVGVNGVSNYDGFIIAGPGYLGQSYEPFRVSGDPNAPNFEVPNIGLKDAGQAARLHERLGLQKSFDQLRRDLDHTGAMKALDAFETKALAILTSSATRRAFDINLEPEKVRERYGRNQWGQQLLLARRLVEAGVEIITTTMDGQLCGRVGNWDDHAVNHNIFEAIKYRAAFFDQAVAALIEDIYTRGLDKKVMVIVTGEFGRTPRISRVASSGDGIASAKAGVVQPGRDHWPSANTLLFAGGGIRTGQVIGGTDKRGEYVSDRRVGVGDFLATVYHHLGIDYEKVAIKNFSGRPIPIVKEGKAIRELTAV